MRKKQQQFYIVFFVILLLAVGVMSIYMFDIKLPFASTETNPQGQYIGVPTYGWFKCEMSERLISLNDGAYTKFGSGVFDCHKGGDTLPQQCTVTFKTPTKTEFDNMAGWGVKEAAFIYTICDQGQACDISAGQTGNHIITLRHIYNDYETELGKIINEELSANQYIYAEYQEGGLISSVKGTGTIKNDRIGYTISWYPFYVYKYDIFSQTTGQPVTDSRDCNIAVSSLSKNIITDVSGNGKLSEQLQAANDISIRGQGMSLPFLTGIYVATIPQQMVSADEYCYDSKIYRVETVTVTGGTYKVANTATNAEVKTVDCCNDGDAISKYGTGYYCDNLVAKKKAESEGQECNVLKPCPIVGYQYAPGKAVYQECVANKCVTGTINVACSALAADCPGGYCEVDQNNPANNKCVTVKPNEHCGNGVCDADLGEDYVNCSRDCTKKEEPNYFFWIIVGLVALVVILLIILVAKLSGGKNSNYF